MRTELITPVPVTPAPGFTARLATLQGYVTAEAAEGGYHGNLTLTGRTYVTAEDGAVWYEASLDGQGTDTAWVSWDVAPDPRAPLPATETALTGWVDDADYLL